MPSQVDTYLASRSPPAEMAASWRCDLIIKFLTPYYNSQFVSAFILQVIMKPSDASKRPKLGLKISLTFSKIY